MKSDELQHCFKVKMTQKYMFYLKYNHTNWKSNIANIRDDLTHRFWFSGFLQNISNLMLQTITNLSKVAIQWQDSLYLASTWHGKNHRAWT